MRSNAAVKIAVLDIMRVMAFGADEPTLLAGASPCADALAMNAVAPIAENVAVTFATQ